MKIEEKTEGKMKAGGRSLDPRGPRRSPDGAPGSSKGTESARPTAVSPRRGPWAPPGAPKAPFPWAPPGAPWPPWVGPGALNCWAPRPLGPMGPEALRAGGRENKISTPPAQNNTVCLIKLRCVCGALPVLPVAGF